MIFLGGINFSQMTPQHSLISNSSVNSMLAKTGSEYLACILNDASATLNLTGISGLHRHKYLENCSMVGQRRLLWQSRKRRR
jgi:hypothetical protein